MSDKEKIKSLLQSSDEKNIKTGIALACGLKYSDEDITALALPDNRAAYTGFRFELNNYKIKLKDKPMDDITKELYEKIAEKPAELCCVVILETPFGTTKTSWKVYHYTDLVFMLIQYVYLAVQSETDTLITD